MPIVPEQNQLHKNPWAVLELDMEMRINCRSSEVGIVMQMAIYMTKRARVRLLKDSRMGLELIRLICLTSHIYCNNTGYLMEQKPIMLIILFKSVPVHQML